MTKFFTIIRQSIATTAAVAAIAAAGGALIAAPAFAETAGMTTTTTSVSYAGLDLSSKDGQAKMQSRVRAAARQVCGYNAGERDLNEIAHQNVCIAKAMDGAQVELAALTTTSNSGQRIAVSEAADRNVPGTAR